MIKEIFDKERFDNDLGLNRSMLDLDIGGHSIRDILRKISPRYLVLITLIIYIGFPLYWSVLSAFRPTSVIFSDLPPLVPLNPTLEQFRSLLTDTPFPTYFLNSAIVGIGTVVVTTVLATLGGYGLTLSRFRGKTTMARTVLFVYMFPPILLSLPLYRVFFRLDLLNSRMALTIAHSAISLPFCLWLMWQFFQAIPMSYEESAWVYGAGRIQALKDVVLPLALPGVVACMIFTFAVTWNEYTFAVIVMTETATQTIPVGVDSFMNDASFEWGWINAAGAITMIPPFLLVLFLQDYILEGFSTLE